MKRTTMSHARASYCRSFRDDERKMRSKSDKITNRRVKWRWRMIRQAPISLGTKHEI